MKNEFLIAIFIVVNILSVHIAYEFGYRKGYMFGKHDTIVGIREQMEEHKRKKGAV